MAVTLIGSNLITTGDNGTFESDSSAWGSVLYMGLSTVLPFIAYGKNGGTAAYEGYGWYRAYLKQLYSVGNTPFSYHDEVHQTMLHFIEMPFTVGKKYILKARVYAPLPQIGTTGTKFGFYFPNTDGQINTIAIDAAETTYKTVDECVNNWQEITLAFQVINPGTISKLTFAIVVANSNDDFMAYEASGTITADPSNKIYIDKIEAYEYSPITGPTELTFDNIYFSRNPISQIVSAPVLAGESFVNANAKTAVELIQGNDNYLDIFRQVTEPVNDAATFRLESVVDSKLTLSPPNEVLGTIEELTDRIKRFQFFEGKTINDEEVPSTWFLTKTALVLKGGISTLKFPSVDFFGQYYLANKPFLTWQSKSKTVIYDQEEFLYYFVNDASIHQLKLTANIYYEDGTTTNLHQIVVTDQDFADTSTTIKGRLFVFPAGRENAVLNFVDPTKNILKYDMFLRNQDGLIVTEIRTYIVDYLKNPNTEYFLFANSLGGFDSLAATGKTQEMMEVTKDLYESTLPENYSVKDAQLHVLKSRFKDTFKSNSGYLKSKTEANYLAHELINSEQVYLLVNKVRVAIVIKTSKITISTDENYKWFVAFEYEIAFTNQSFTPIGA